MIRAHGRSHADEEPTWLIQGPVRLLFHVNPTPENVLHLEEIHVVPTSEDSKSRNIVTKEEFHVDIINAMRPVVHEPKNVVGTNNDE